MRRPEAKAGTAEPGLGRPAPYLLAAFICILLESAPLFDRLAQAPFFRHGKWLITRELHSQYKWLLYTGPKVCIGIIGGVFLVVFLASLSKKYRLRLQNWRKPSLIIVCGIMLVPLAVSTLKAVSGVYSPVDTLPYGGKHPHIGLLGQLWAHGAPAGGRSFPAGHASGGFALISLYTLPLRRKWKQGILIFGLLAGWGMGLYQMARGEHFLSHTLAAMFLALGIISFLDRRLPGSARLTEILTEKR